MTQSIRWIGAGSLGAVVILASVGHGHAAEGRWRGLVVAPEQRCAPYDRETYPYPQSVENDIVTDRGNLVSPYTCEVFHSKTDTDIEHIIALSEAHDSGLCASGLAARRAFSSDRLNLTLASPLVNRDQKGAKDVADWVPARNACWFASRVVAVRQKYALTIDQREAEAIDQILDQCAEIEIDCPDVLYAEPLLLTLTPAQQPEEPQTPEEWLKRCDANGNGRVTCAEARAESCGAPIPVTKDHPLYQFMRDGDGDGQVCE